MRQQPVMDSTPCRLQHMPFLGGCSSIGVIIFLPVAKVLSRFRSEFLWAIAIADLQ